MKFISYLNIIEKKNTRRLDRIVGTYSCQPALLNEIKPVYISTYRQTKQDTKIIE